MAIKNLGWSSFLQRYPITDSLEPSAKNPALAASELKIIGPNFNKGFVALSIIGTMVLKLLSGGCIGPGFGSDAVSNGVFTSSGV